MEPLAAGARPPRGKQPPRQETIQEVGPTSSRDHSASRSAIHLCCDQTLSAGKGLLESTTGREFVDWNRCSAPEKQVSREDVGNHAGIKETKRHYDNQNHYDRRLNRQRSEPIGEHRFRFTGMLSCLAHAYGCRLVDLRGESLSIAESKSLALCG